MLPLELTATPAISPKWMSLGSLSGFATDSNGIVGTDCASAASGNRPIITNSPMACRFTLSLHFRVCTTGRLSTRGLPGRCALFPLVIGDLLDACAVVPHHEQLAVRLRRVRVRHLVLVSHPRRCKHDVLAVRGPTLMGIVPRGMRQAFHASAIRLDREYLVVALFQTGKHDQIAAGRPRREGGVPP